MFDFSSFDQDIENVAHNGLAVGIGNFSTGQIDTHITYRKDWQDLYFQQNWMHRDPVVVAGLTGTRTRRWSEIDLSASPVFSAAREFDLRNGYVISQDIGGSRLIAGLSTKEHASSASIEFAERALREFHMKHLITKAQNLSFVQRHMVYMFANGAMAKQVAVEHSVSVNAIKQRKERVKDALGVNSFTAVVNVCALAGITLHPTN